MQITIEKSGTGIEKSGTGIERSGTGRKLRGLALAVAMAVGTLGATSAIANDDKLLISSQNNHFMITLHGSDGVMVGAISNSQFSPDYQLIPLYSALRFAASGTQLQPLVVATGSGAAGEVVATGSGAAGEVVATGSGAAGEVVATGSGAAGEVVATGSGGAGEVVATGSGGAGEFVGCAVQPWGFAEVVSDADGMHVMIHRVGSFGLEEYLVGFFSAVSGNVGRAGHAGLIDGTWSHDFIATP